VLKNLEIKKQNICTVDRSGFARDLIISRQPESSSDQKQQQHKEEESTRPNPPKDRAGDNPRSPSRSAKVGSSPFTSEVDFFTDSNDSDPELTRYSSRVMRRRRKFIKNGRLNKMVTKYNDLFHSPKKCRKKDQKSILRGVPADCIEQWKKQCWRELNRFAKLASTPHIISIKGEHLAWSDRICQDLQRARRLIVCGDVNESFDFPSFSKVEDRECLVDTCVKFLNTSIEDLISENCTSLSSECRRALAVKAVNQALTSLCQDFINEPYFKILKNACEKFHITPTSSSLQREPLSKGSWLAGIQIKVETPRLYCYSCRTFKTIRLDNPDLEEAGFVFGFKRTYVIDIMGGPPKILPPIWLAKSKKRALEFYSADFPEANFRAASSDQEAAESRHTTTCAPS